MKNKFFIIVFTFVTVAGFGQSKFISKGKIEFERKVNMHADLEGDFAEQFKKQIPQFYTTYFDLIFSDSRSVYKPGREGDKKNNMWGSPATENVVYSDFVNKKYLARKQVYEQAYLIEDSLRHAVWKITNDKRDIAGYECRRATTVIMDSVFVVAFYTDEIMCSGGPESFTGLPGTILGLVIPRMHTTWYATKVENYSPKPEDLLPPTKGKKTNNLQLKTTLTNSLKDWGKWAQRNIWAIMI